MFEEGRLSFFYSGLKGVYAAVVQKACMLQAPMKQGTDLKSVPFQAVAYSSLEPL